MKSYLLKSLSILLVVFALGCSEEQTALPEEESSNKKELAKAEKTALDIAGRRAVHTILGICPQDGADGFTFVPLCDFGLDPSITIYHSMQSPNCPDVFMVWVDSLEYYAVYPTIPPGTRHVIIPPVPDEPPYFPIEDHEDCFN